jgi:hypothetical protein
MLMVSVALVGCLVLLGIYLARNASLWPDTSKPLSESELVASYAPEAYGLPDYIGGFRVLAVFSDKNWPCMRDELGITLANSGSISLSQLDAELVNYGFGEMIVFAPADTSVTDERQRLAEMYKANKGMPCDYKFYR